MKLRAYTVSDVFTLVDLLASISGTMGESLKGLLRAGGSNITEEEATDRGIELVLLVLNKSYVGAKDKLITFLASLLEMTVDEFLKQPPETVLNVIEEIVTRKETKDFFYSACRLFNKTGNF